MKKIALLLLIVISTAGIIVSCTTTDTGDTTDSEAVFTQKSDTRLEVGYEDTNGEYFVNRENLDYIKEQWDTEYDMLISKFIIEKRATDANPDEPGNNGGEECYLLIGIDETKGQSAAMVVDKINLSFQAPASVGITVKCIGCTEGCDVSCRTVGGRKTPYCANPCIDCSKEESETTTTKTRP